MNILRYFTGAFVFAAICLALGGLVGFHSGHSFASALSGIFICLILGVMEVSLSFDNAVVNATVLRGMSRYWQRMFLTVGVLIAVFGMRLVFPLLIVAVTAHVNPWAALLMALNSPSHYAALLSGAHASIMGFGGAFLLLVAFSFFMDSEKDSHWISPLEKPLASLGALPGAGIGGTLALVVLASRCLVPAGEQVSFLYSGLYGILAWFCVEGLGEVMNVEKGAAKSGLAAFLYLEMLDSSFSFDGVIGAFALSSNLLIIALGLGIGAMFVRSLTVMLVEKGVLSEYRYLEHGAFWAILVLALLMFVGVAVDVPEVVTGLLGGGLIGLAFISSVLCNRREAGR